MNPVLQYAVAHRPDASRFLISQYGVSLDDAEDIIQTAMLRVLQANPDGRSPRAYWLSTLRATFCDFWRRWRSRPTCSFAYGEDGGLLTDVEDPRQDCARSVEAVETIREAWAVATPVERESIRVAMMVNVRHLPDRARQGLSRVRRKLRAAVA